MGFRFRKSIKLAPGIRMNFSGSGASFTFGPRGASIGVGSRGTYLNTGIPGTGLYTRERLDDSSKPQNTSPGKVSISLMVGVNDDGTLYFHDQHGNAAPEQYVSMAKKQQPEVIRNQMQKKCDEINESISVLGEIHLGTSSPLNKPVFNPSAFGSQKPQFPVEKKPGFFGKFFSGIVNKIKEENIAATRSYEVALTQWKDEEEKYLVNENSRRYFIEKAIYVDVQAMEQFLEGNLHDIVWPRETNVSFDIVDDGKQANIDIDLPEIEDIPNKMASMPQRNFKLSIKEMSDAQVRKLYLRHIHSVVFRVVGETFAALPVAQKIVISGFTQRPNPSTGVKQDDYLISVMVDRSRWEKIDFNNLNSLDIVEAIGRFEVRLDMNDRTGAWKPILPF